MVAEIRWSSNAVKDYNSIVDYLLVSWSVDIAARFIETTEDKISRIVSHKLIGIRSSGVDNIRSILLTNHNRLYYRIVSKQVIEIVNILDTRQDPSKNKYEKGS